MSVFADDLLVICKRRALSDVRHTIDGELKVIWGEALEEGAGWIRYLGKEWSVRNGDYSVRVPPAYWRDLLVEVGLAE
eukprot:9841948-Heterocapsa_arctica.AAC.1